MGENCFLKNIFKKIEKILEIKNRRKFRQKIEDLGKNVERFGKISEEVKEKISGNFSKILLNH